MIPLLITRESLQFYCINTSEKFNTLFFRFFVSLRADELAKK